MSRILSIITVAALVSVWLGACEGDPPKTGELQKMNVSRVRTDRTYIRDAYDRYVQFSGTNVGGSSKAPYTVDPLSYIGRPFPLEEADRHFKQIKSMGFNAIRLLFMWEAIEPDKKGEYNEEFLDYFEQIIAKAQEHGLYVLINCHENLFSRHLYVHYNENTDVFYTDEFLESGREKNFLLDSVLATFPQIPEKYKDRASRLTAEDWQKIKPEDFFSDVVTGDGAPKWAVETCLPEKAPYIGGRQWGVYRPLGSFDLNTITSATELLAKLGMEGGESDLDIDKLAEVYLNLLKAKIFPNDAQEGPKQASTLAPFTFWGINSILSTDVERCYAAFYAGDKVYPGLTYEMNGERVSVKEYLQDSFEKMWVQVAKRAKKYDNVIGYDIQNEPVGVFLILTAAAAYFQAGMRDSVEDLLNGLLGPNLGPDVSKLVFGLNMMVDMDPYPMQTADMSDEDFQAAVEEWEAQLEEKKKQWGYEYADLMAMLEMNIGFDKNFLQPLYERVGRAIQKEDPNAIIWIEEGVTPEKYLGGGGFVGQWQMNMTRPEGIDQVVFTPHWYPDIYPNLGFNVDPREFTAEEWEFRNWVPELEQNAHRAEFSLGNIPVVYGEFGTYFNYNGIDWSVENDYSVSEQILDNYYESFEALNMSKFQWCYTADNDREYGDKWNHEDFSVLDFNQQPRAERAYNRPSARALSGKPVATHFYSDLHYFDPDKGIPIEEHEFYLEFESKETAAPTVIYVPDLQYPDGFYVWLSDGYAVFDAAEDLLYYFPTADEPGRNHKVLIRPPQDNRENRKWRYFFDGDKVVEGEGGGLP